MTVYVDDMYKYPTGQFRNMKMSHMIAEDEQELHAMAQAIGVARAGTKATTMTLALPCVPRQSSAGLYKWRGAR